MVSEPAGESEPESPSEEESQRAVVRREKVIYLLVFIGLGGFLGIVPDDSIFMWLGILAELFCVVRWVQLDAWEKQIRLPRWLLVLVVGIALVGVPVYLLRSRGWNGMLSILCALLILACQLGAGALAMTLAGRV